MKIIAADIGNSSIKVGLQSDSEFNYYRLKSADDIEQLELPSDAHFWSVCSVNQEKCQQLQNWQQTNRSNDHFHIISHDDIPIESNVEDLYQIGMDRLVAAFNALRFRPENEDLIVIDAGTAVTIDRIDSDAIFQGGVIFPGAKVNLQSLAKATCQLPSLAHENSDLKKLADKPIGKNTEHAILSGVFHAQLYALINIANLLSKDDNVIATGGQTSLFSGFLPPSWKFCEQMVLQGALEIGRLEQRQ